SRSVTSAATAVAPAASIRGLAAGSESIPATPAPAPASRRQSAAPMNPPAPVTAILRPRSSAPSAIGADHILARVLRPARAPKLRPLVRTAAAAAIAAAVAVPLLRRRLRVPAPATLAAVVAGPLGLAVLRPRTRGRDAALFALQMWAFLVAGELPGARLQRALAGRGGASALDRVLSVVHWAWFAEPHAALLYLLVRR